MKRARARASDMVDIRRRSERTYRGAVLILALVPIGIAALALFALVRWRLP